MPVVTTCSSEGCNEQVKTTHFSQLNGKVYCGKHDNVQPEEEPEDEPVVAKKTKSTKKKAADAVADEVI